MKEKEPRKHRAYKMAETPYQKALKRGNGLLATLIECWVTSYGQGATIQVVPPKSNKSVKK